MADAETWANTIPGGGDTDIGGQGETWSNTNDAPVTASGTAAQLGRGAEAGVYHTLGAPVDVGTELADQHSFAQQAGADLWHLITTGQYGAKPTMPQHAPVPGGSEWMMGEAGQVSPQLDPRNYPAQNWPERIARGAGDVGTQAALGRLGTSGFQMARGVPPITPPPTGPLALPSSISIGKQLAETAKQTAGAGIAGAGGGAGGQIGRGVAEHAIDVDPDFRRLHPAMANVIEGLGGTIGGVGGGLTGTGVASRIGIPGGAPAADISSKDLRGIADSQYNMADSVNANYRAPAVEQFFRDHANNLYDTYGSAEIMPVLSKLNRYANPTRNAVPMKELTALDDQLGKTVKSNLQVDGTPNTLGSAAADTQRAIRNFINNPTPQTVHSGDPYFAASIRQDADANWAASKRSQRLELAQEVGERPGQSVTGEITKLTDPRYMAKRLYGFNPEEKEALNQFVKGSPLRTAVGNLPAEKIGWGSVPFAAWEGYQHAGIPGALVAGAIGPVAGYGMHKLNDFLANRALNRIAEQTRQRSPAYQAIPASARPASPFRTTIPVGLGALSGLQQQ
ncbi:MAG TPA: hypothetical protein VGL12_10255 [Roseiarcus sp.]|jgi:hypothetical protein